MSAAKTLAATFAAAALLGIFAATPAQAAEAAPAPALSIASVPTPTNFVPGDTENEYAYETWIANNGAEATDGSPVTIVDTLPKGLPVEKVEFKIRYKNHITDRGEGAEKICETETVAEVASVTCTVPEELLGSGEESAVLFPGEEWYLRVVVGVGAATEGEALTNLVTVEGGGAPAAARTAENEASVDPAPAGFSESTVELTGPDGQPVGQAGAHPYQMTTSFALNTRHKSPTAEALIPTYTTSGGDVKDIPVALPPGLVGNPQAISRCPLQQFNTSNVVQAFPERPDIQDQKNECPDSSAVGYISIRYGEASAVMFLIPIYNLVPPPGMPAQLGFTLFGLPIYIDTEARPSENYKIVAGVRNISEAKRVIGGAVTLWGTPADPSHDPIRGHCLSSIPEFPISLEPVIGPCPAEIPVKPFLRLPSDCAGPLDIAMGLDSWADPGNFVFAHSVYPAPSGCNALGFEPSLQARPTTDVADSPSGLSVDLHIPQSEPNGLGEADLRKAVVTLPKGLVLNPAQANGLAACSPAQIGIDDESLSGFDDEAAHCPAASRVGKVEVDTPLLENPLHGSVYVAAPFDNPFDSLIAIYIAVADPERGIVVKLAGQVEPDPVTGQLTTTFDDNPQVPFEDFKLDFFGGATAPLRTPAVCGTYSTTSQMTPWSAPESGPPAAPSDTYAISQGAGGGICPTSEGALPNAPSFEAGTLAPIAAAYSPMVIHLRREDGSQEFSSLNVTPPPGLVGRLAGVPYCPDSALAAAAAKAGRAEEAAPSCPAASQVGTVTAGAGAGPAPYYATGRAYLTGPYKGAPLSLAIVTPAVAGPFDLGTVVVKTALYVDPETARITAKSDPIPRILAGIPLDVRSIAVKIDRPDFTLNPTNCETMAFGGSLLSTLGQSAPLSDRFQVGECAPLGFKPKLDLRLKGSAKRGGHPALTATLTYPKGAYANVARASVALPHSEFLEQAHIRTVCTRVQFAAGGGNGAQCPPASIYGRARAITPLLDSPLEGPVYLRSSSNPLPNLVISLGGQVPIVLDGRVDSVHGGIRTTFETVPDAPVSKFVLEMQGGKKGLLVNSRDICAGTNRATAKFTAQNGKLEDSRPVLRNGRCGKAKHRKGKRHHRPAAR
jgi:hypothetical protein